MKLDQAISKIYAEYNEAISHYDKFHNQHEGYAVIKEELDELWDDVKASRDPTQEAVEVGAMVLRFLTELC